HHHHHHHHHHPPTGAAFDGPPVGEHGGKFHDFDVSRQFCRYTATISNDDCFRCCRIAARHITTALNEVRGILFVFDPNRLPVVHDDHDIGSSLRKKRAPFLHLQPSQDPPTPTEPPTTTSTTATPQPPTDSRVTQCVCCAPRKHWGLY
ncbi:hypothetical protein Tcan_10870, partial [Toxocara canis]